MWLFKNNLWSTFKINIKKFGYGVALGALMVCTVGVTSAGNLAHVHAADTRTIDGLWCQTCGKYVTEFVLKPQAGVREDRLPHVGKSIVLVNGVEYYRYIFGCGSHGSYNTISNFLTATIYDYGAYGMLYTGSIGNPFCNSYAIGVSHIGENYKLQICCNCCAEKRPLVTISEGGANIPVAIWNQATDTFYYGAGYSNGNIFSLTNSDAYVGMPTYSISGTKEADKKVYSFIQGMVDMVLNKVGKNGTTTSQAYYYGIPADGLVFTWSDLCTATAQVTPNGTVYKGFATYLNEMGYTSSAIKASSTVSFNANGGTGTMAAVEVGSGESVTLTNKFSRTGYTFQGWATSATGSVVYNNGASFTPDKDTTLYAVWQVNNYNVTYKDVDVDTGVVLNSQTVAKAYGTTVAGSDLGTDTTLSKYYANYVYSNCTNATVGTSGTTVYRYFKLSQYKVTYNANGGSGTMTATTVKAGNSVTLTNRFTRTGYTFQGWSTSTTGNVVYTNGQVIQPGSNLNLFAVWGANNYVVTYKDIDLETNKVLGSTTLNKLYGTTIAGSDIGTVTTVGAYYPNYYYSYNTSATVGTNAEQNVVYRYFLLKRYNISFNGNGSTDTMDNVTVDSGKSIKLTNRFTRQGYTFKGWAMSRTDLPIYENNTIIYPNGNLALYASWEQILIQ